MQTGTCEMLWDMFRQMLQQSNVIFNDVACCIGSTGMSLGFKHNTLFCFKMKVWTEDVQKPPQTGASSRCSKFTLNTCYIVPGNLPCHLIQLSTMWWPVDSSAALCTQVKKHPKHIAAGPMIQLQSRSLSFGSRYQAHSGTAVCLEYIVCYSRTTHSTYDQKRLWSSDQADCSSDLQHFFEAKTEAKWSPELLSCQSSIMAFTILHNTKLLILIRTLHSRLFNPEVHFI